MHEQMVDECTQASSNERATLEYVKSRIKAISVDLNILKIDNFGAVSYPYMTNCLLLLFIVVVVVYYLA